MGVFLAASDEASGQNIFHHAGYLAPIACWNQVVVPAWQEKVLNGPPRMNEFHIVDLRDRPWRDKHGITRDDAEARIDAAAEILSETRGLYAVGASIDGAHFEKHSRGLRFKSTDPRRGPADYVIDYPAFLAYVYTVLQVCAAFPKTEKVDFVIEKKREVFPAIRDFYEGLRAAFVDFDLPHFAQIMGELTSGDKQTIPLQAADTLCWHTQRRAANDRNPSILLSETDSMRFSKMTRLGARATWSRQLIEEMCDGLFEDWRKLNEGE